MSNFTETLEPILIPISVTDEKPTETPNILVNVIPKIWHLDPETNELIAEKFSRMDPRDPSRVVVPRGATSIAPPVAENGKARVFKQETGTWEQVVDNRHLVKYIGKNKVDFKLGDEVTNDMTDEVVQPIAELIAQKKQEVISLFRETEKSTITINDTKYNADYNSINELVLVKNMSYLNRQSTVIFIDSENNRNKLTLEEADNIIQTLWEDYEIRYTNQKLTIKEIDNLGDNPSPLEIEQVDYDPYRRLDLVNDKIDSVDIGLSIN